MATKRVGWGALLKSVKDKKQKQEDEAEDAPPAKKLKSEIKTDASDTKKKDVKVAPEKSTKKEAKKEDKKAVEKKVEKKEEGTKGKKKEEGTKGKKKEEKADESFFGSSEVKKRVAKTETIEDKKDNTKKPANNATNGKETPKQTAKETNATTNNKKETTNKKETEIIKKDPTTEEREKNHQTAKDAVRVALGKKPYHDFAAEEPIVVHVGAEKVEGEHNFYLDLLAKSYLSNYAQSVSFKKHKLVLGFDIEFLHTRILTIQLSTSSLSIVFNLHSPKTKKSELSKGLHHILSSVDYIKCGVGVPTDLVALETQFDVKFSAMFDISWFVLDMGLSRAPWSLDVLSADIFSIGKVNEFKAKSYVLTPDQIQYAARDAWLGYKLTDYFYDFFTQGTPSMYSWTRAYSDKKETVLADAISAEKPSKEEKEKKQKEEEEEEEEEESESEEDKDEEDKKVTQETIVASALKKGAESLEASRSTVSIKPSTIETNHIIRNKLESIKGTRNKSKREDQMFTTLVQQLNDIKDGKVDTTKKKEETEDEIIYNWV